MPEYAILHNPGANKVYAETSKLLLCAEFRALSDCCFLGIFSEPAMRTMGGVEYLVFQATEQPDERAISGLSMLSSAYALYELRQKPEIHLLPLNRTVFQYFDDDITTIPKYSGKTNELFTRLLVNLGCFVLRRFPGERLRILDPVCGRGTTLSVGLTMGFDVAGVELSRSDFEQMTSYFRRYCEIKHYKHSIQEGRIRDAGKKVGQRFEMEVGRDRQEWKAGEGIQLHAVQGDTTQTDEYFKRQNFDLIVADLPYGVQHGSMAGGLSRSPRELVKLSLPAWDAVLRRSGCMVLAWNTFVLAREELSALLTEFGYEVLSGATWEQFSHRVDQAIARDIIVARPRV